MDSPVLALVIALLFAFTVESQRIPYPQPPESPSPPASPVSPPWPPPPPPHYHPHRPPTKPPTPRNLSPPPKKRKANKGKKIGLVFVGVASLLQVCIVAFLLFSRRQLFKAQNGYQRN